MHDNPLGTNLSRRALLAGSLGAGLTMTAVDRSLASPTSTVSDSTFSTAALTVLATTDIHGHVFDWDYFADAAFPPSDKGRSSAPLGVSRVATIAKQVRAEQGADSVVMLDNGDTIQGAPLTYLSAKQPEKLGHDEVMARALNPGGYGAANIGNHEFNYGVAELFRYHNDLKAPLLCANVIDVKTGKPLTQGSLMLTKNVAGHEVKVGIVAVTTPAQWCGTRQTWSARSISLIQSSPPLDTQYVFAKMVPTSSSCSFMPGSPRFRLPRFTTGCPRITPPCWQSLFPRLTWLSSVTPIRTTPLRLLTASQGTRSSSLSPTTGLVRYLK
ncbi:Tat pathway signal sequence domain protein [Cutibacterium acnes HL005PA2]|nr:Tat pathway signal sequence domain protein [Cutibacterium acnes HL005PA2]